VAGEVEEVEEGPRKTRSIPFPFIREGKKRDETL
jgi:hypothetical protein